MKIAFAIALSMLQFYSFSQGKSSWEIPFQLENNCIYIYCKVNETDSVRFLFDTGADGSVINSDSDKQLHLKIDGKSVNRGSNGSDTVFQSTGNRVVFDGLEQTDIPFTLISFGTNSLDGVFGTDLMKNYIIEINYDRKNLKFSKKDHFKTDLRSYDKIRIHYVASYPSIKCNLVIQGKRYSGLFGLDSGADDALTIASPYGAKNEFKQKTQQIASSVFQGSDGSTYEMSIVEAPELQVGKKVFYRIPMNLSNAKEGIDATEDMAGFFGNNFLKRFNVVLDLGKGFIYLKPNANLYVPFF
nr:retropepsin-like aspartic protease [uncultured Fluviicola sp.]